MRRLVQPETLDHLAPADPQAIGSRADLARLHRIMGTAAILRRAMLPWTGCARPGQPIRILELGAGDGSLLLRLARRLSPIWPRVELTLMDRQDVVSAETIAAYAALGWTVSVSTADVLDWAGGDHRIDGHGGSPSPAGPAAPSAPEHWHIVVANLFLHHFDTPELARVLLQAARCSDRFIACEPRRSIKALAASHLVGAIGANAVTREDAVLSVRAGFCASELSALWPGDPHQWQVSEYPAGLFSHCFLAQRRSARSRSGASAATGAPTSALTSTPTSTSTSAAASPATGVR